MRVNKAVENRCLQSSLKKAIIDPASSYMGVAARASIVTFNDARRQPSPELARLAIIAFYDDIDDREDCMGYPGGKSGSGVYQKIINLMPPHETYVEPFLGGGAIMRIKRPAVAASIGLDIDAGALHDFAALSLDWVDLHCQDAFSWLRSSDLTQLPTTLIYCDPPYLMATRRSQRAYYHYELGEDAQHVELLQLLLE